MLIGLSTNAVFILSHYQLSSTEHNPSTKAWYNAMNSRAMYPHANHLSINRSLQQSTELHTARGRDAPTQIKPTSCCNAICTLMVVVDVLRICTAGHLVHDCMVESPSHAISLGNAEESPCITF
jgi:hypothetical protein